MLEKLKNLAPEVPQAQLKTLNDFAYSVLWSNDPDYKESEENPFSITLPHFPLDSLNDAAMLLVRNSFTNN
jgi:hypothetical protein